jgi:hypothetical protein
MNAPTPEPVVPVPVTDAALDAVLRDDSILPSCGFTASVMDALARDSAATAVLRFPWKRALPGFVLAAVTALAVLAMLVGAIVSVFSHAAANGPVATLALTDAPGTFAWRLHWQSLLQSTTTAGIVWPLAALILSGLCLLVCRRLIASH